MVYYQTQVHSMWADKRMFLYYMYIVDIVLCFQSIGATIFACFIGIFIIYKVQTFPDGCRIISE